MKCSRETAEKVVAPPGLKIEKGCLAWYPQPVSIGTASGSGSTVLKMYAPASKLPYLALFLTRTAIWCGREALPYLIGRVRGDRIETRSHLFEITGSHRIAHQE